MARVNPLEDDNLPHHLSERFSFVEEILGFIPNSLKTMARIPGLVEAFSDLSSVVLGNSVLPAELRGLISLMVSTGAECRYCQAHTSSSALQAGVKSEKLSDIWNFETSSLFTDSEVVALRFAFHAGQIPNAVTDEDTKNLRAHFSDEEITAIVSICALYGYLNRWNDTMATQLEDHPRSFAEAVLGPNGWETGKHY